MPTVACYVVHHTLPRYRALPTKEEQYPPRLDPLKAKPANPVTLVFGRPDIGAYLKDTFAMQMGSPCCMDENGLDTSGRMDVSASYRDLPQSAEP